MKNVMVRWRLRWVAAALAALIVLPCGCGVLIDEERIKVADFDGKPFTRGDLRRVIREMPSEERPIIATKGDMLRVLKQYFDTKLKEDLGRRLTMDGTLKVPREVAAAMYDQAHPDALAFMQHANLAEWEMDDRDLVVMKEERERQIDRIYDKLCGEQAVQYKAREGLSNGTITIPEEEFEKQYALRKDELNHFENVVIEGLCFIQKDAESAAEANALAADARKRLDAGESLQVIAQERKKDKSAIHLQLALENDPRRPQYRGFWDEASGADIGTLLGPVFIRGWSAGQDEAGNPRFLPDGFLVCIVRSHAPMRPKTLDEARVELALDMAYTRVMENLRQEHGLVIYEDKLPDPTYLSEDRPESIFDTDKPGAP